RQRPKKGTIVNLQHPLRNLFYFNQTASAISGVIHLDVHLAQAGVLRLQLFHTRTHGYIHAAVLRAPLVEGCRADAQLPAKLRYRQAGLYPLERFHDLTVRKPRPLHLVELLNEKILLLNAPLLRGDYRYGRSHGLDNVLQPPTTAFGIGLHESNGIGRSMARESIFNRCLDPGIMTAKDGGNITSVLSSRTLHRVLEVLFWSHQLDGVTQIF